MFADISLIWDLSNYIEIKVCVSPQHFATAESYVRNGIFANVPQESEGKMDKAKHIIENEEFSLFIRPKVTNYSNYF